MFFLIQNHNSGYKLITDRKHFYARD